MWKNLSVLLASHFMKQQFKTLIDSALKVLSGKEHSRDYAGSVDLQVLCVFLQ